MNYEEAIDNLNNKFLLCPIDCAEDCEACRIEAVQLAIEALEKQIPKKPHITTMEYAYSAGKRTIRNCPYCYEVRGLGLWKSLIDKPTPYCRRCGQAIDWSEVE